MNYTYTFENKYSRLFFILFLLVFVSLDSIGQEAGKTALPATSVLAGNSMLSAGSGNINATAVIANEFQKAQIQGQPSKRNAAFSRNTAINLTSFSQSRLNKSKEAIAQNIGYEQDPELGVLFPNAPCNDCYELISKRTETQKYFVVEGSDTKKFILQSSQYPVHYKDVNGQWRTISDGLQADKEHAGVYTTKGRPVEVAINTKEGFASLTSSGNSMIYNRGLELIFIHPDGTEQSLGKANWSNFSAGDNGVRVKNAWPGIDIEMNVLVNSLKTNFVINSAMPAYAGGKLLLRDHMQLKGLSLNAAENKDYFGKILLNDKNESIFTIQPAIAYSQSGPNAGVKELNYQVDSRKNIVSIEVPGNLLDQPASAYPLVVDPLVSGTLSAGFTYNTTGSWPPLIPSTGAYCTNTNIVTIPAAATLTDIQVTFNYYGPSGIAWAQSQLAFQINGGCSYSWLSCGAAVFSSGIPGGTCGLTNSTFWSAGPLWGTTAGCVPAYSCSSYSLPFQLLLTQRQTSTAACAQTVYATASGFTVNVFGSVAALPVITPAGPATVCMPTTLPLAGSPAGGVWSSSVPAVATVPGGVVTGLTNGTTNITYTASGCTSSIAVTVGTTPSVTGSTSICFPGSTTLAGSPAGGTWTSSTPSVATVTGGLVNGVSIGTTIINYNTGTCSRSVPVDVNSPGGASPTTQPTGITFTGTSSSGTTINFTPNGSMGYLVVASTASSLSAAPLSNTTYPTGSAFGGGIVLQGSSSGSSPSYTTTLLNSNTHYYIFVFAFNNNCTGQQYNSTGPLTGNFNTCVAVPGTPTVVSAGSNSINLSWTASAAGGGALSPVNYNVYAYSDAALTIPVPGYPLVAGTGTTYTATGLASGTQYWFRIAPADACNIMSGTVSGLTSCATLATLPYLQTFDVSATIGDHNPNCMTSNVQNCVFSAIQNNVTYVGTINNNHTAAGINFYNFFPGGACSAGWQNQWLVTPGFAMTAGTTYKVSFWYRTDGNNWPSLQVQYGSSATVPAVTSSTMGGTTASIGAGLSGISNTVYTQYIQTFTVPTSGTYYVGIDAAATSAASFGLLAIDDIEICAVPNVTVTNSTAPYCEPATVVLGTTGSGAVTYAWSGPSSFSSTLASPSVSGLTAGTYTYSLTAVNDPVSAGFGGYCSTTGTTSLTVSPPPAAITGTFEVCTGATTTLADPVSGGTWSSSNLLVGTINASGVFSGLTAGTSTITYSVGGCYTTQMVTVYAMPGPIVGSPVICLGSAVTYTNAVTTGVFWSSSNVAIASISVAGTAIGAMAGTTTITCYTSSSCYVTTVVSVNPYPNAISGSSSVCLGSTTSLSSTTGGGIWSSSTPAVATVGIASGLVSGVSVGTTIISYRVAGCSITFIVTVVASPAPIVGPTSICSAYPSFTYTNSSAGGTWSSSNTNVSINSVTGVATGGSAGTSIITYALSAGCFTTLTVTVLPVPTGITGTFTLCQGSTTTLAHSASGGTWSSGSTSVATVGVVSGIVTGVATGSLTAATATITYTLPTGCIATAIVTVNPVPANIIGVFSVCQGATTALSDAITGGSWSSGNTAIGTVDALTGVVYGVLAGTTPVSYTLSTGCSVSVIVTVNPIPSPITGSNTVCVGSCVLQSDASAGGAWSNTPATIASVSGTGNVCGLLAGTTTITYSLSTSCQVTKIVTVTPGAGPISGSLAVCVGNCATLTSATGGTWTSSDPTIATITSGGLYCSVGGAGTVTITNTMPLGCTATVVVTVNTLPGAITSSTGSASVCVGSTIALSNTSISGTWSSSNPAVGTIDPASGLFTGISGGTTTVTYSLGTGCTTSIVVTVTALPAPITGSLSVCIGSSSLLSSTTGGGSWSSSNTGIAAIGLGTGNMSGIAAGNATISYILAPSGCYTTAQATVNALPAAITGTTLICVGAVTPLSSATTGGTWLSSNTVVGTINTISGGFTGLTAGTSVVSYTAATGCKTYIVVTVNALPSVIAGTLSVCEGATTALTSSPAGGTWASSNTAIATVSSAGLVTGISSLPAPGTANIIYTGSNSCARSATVTVNPAPSPITGTLNMCIATTTTLSTTSSGGSWTSSNTAVATVGLTSGIVNGLTSGTSIISYSYATGCRRTAIVTVYALPNTISGALVVCEGSNATLSNTPIGGTWTSSNPGVGTIGLTSGIVTGISGYGTTTITYTLGTGCIATAVETVNPLPSSVTGTLTTCVGATTPLATLSTGGNWSSSNISVATVNATSGLVSGIAAGTAGITYTLPTGCRTMAIVTVYALPAPISGSLLVCVNATTALSNTSAGGTWASSNTGAATISSTSGLVTGISGPATSVITYTLGTGCINTAIVSVNPLPANISGSLGVCIGLTTALSSSPSGGTWASSNTAVGTVGLTSGIVSGIAFGTAVITYTSILGCYNTAIVSVNGLPGAITGTLTVCEGLTTALNSLPSGGTWTSSATNASVGFTSGIVSGNFAGTAVITYALGTGCINTAIVTVNPLPAAIGGSLNVCVGSSTILTDASPGGTWSSSDPTTASVDALGVVSGHVAGTVLISYTYSSTACVRTAVVTVNPLPLPVTGSSGFCNLTSTIMASATPGGVTWGSVDPSIVTIDPVTGVATGAAVGTGTITATTSFGCIATKTVTIILAPYPITGPSDVCLGTTATLGNTITGGTWSSSNPAGAPVDMFSGAVFGNAIGTANIVYVLSTGCSSSHPVTVDPVPAGISGSLLICEAQTTALSNSVPGGSWSSGDLAVGTIDAASGIATGLGSGTAIITYSLATGCNATAVLSVNPLPGPITGSLFVCQGATTALGDTTAVGIWSSSNPGIAYVDPATGLVYGVNPPTAFITYTLGTGCLRTVQVTVSPLPTGITGINNICQGDQVTLADATSGGVWVSSDGSIASIDAASGLVTGVSAGIAVISYVLPSGCAATILFTVNGLPAPITGSLSVCAGFATNLTDATPSGTWASDASAAGVGTINNITGVFTGITPGTSNITYTLPSGCKTNAVVTVIVLPSVISGPAVVCRNATVTLTDAAGGGTWSSSNTATATVDVATGLVTGVNAGSVTITYHVGTGCFNVLNMTVNPLPSVFTGNAPVCAGSTIVLGSSPAGGVWISTNTSIATIDAPAISGIVRGVSGGTVLITYVHPFTGCIRDGIVTVNATPAAINGPGYVCQGSTVTLTDDSTGGVWSSSNTGVATIGSASGIITPVTLGTANISYSYSLPGGSGCYAVKQVTVSPLPVVYNVEGGGSYCAGGTGVPVNLSGSQIGVSYVLYYGSSVTGYLSGTGSALNFGLQTLAGVYTVHATYVASGCTQNMSGSQVVSITTPATPTVSISTGGNDSTCPGTSVTLTANPINGGTTPAYIWKVNGVTVSTSNPYTFVPADGDVASVAMTSNQACVVSGAATAGKTLHVLPTETPLVSISAVPGDTICQFSPVAYTATGLYTGNSPEYRWIVNGIYVSVGESYSYVPVNGDVVGVRMVSNYLCRLADTVSGGNTTMTVDSMRAPHVTIVSDSGLTTGPGNPISLHAIVTDGGPDPLYQWKVNGHPVPGATTADYSSTFFDYDSVTCAVVTSGVCHNIASFQWVYISVNPASVGHVGLGSGDIKLIPNPNKGAFAIKGTIGTTNDEELSLEITDMLGQVVYRGKTTATHGKIDQQLILSGNLANGMYLLNISSANEHMVFHFVMEQ